ncbi:MAG: class II aldolase/adducin family protein [Parvularculaceae bacterium]|jgi:ribulose-5-phosphate 4-epimerase/fuculose-1-phosphate aldolase|nr:class II aldolase/adducin family protein [Parvularculaceae bacterium]
MQTAMKSIDAQPGFTLPDPKTLPSLRGTVSWEEWRLRCDLAATYRLVALYGWDDMIFTHISVRCPDEGGKPRFLLNPYGLMFEEMTASALLKVDTDGQVVQESPYFSNPAGFTIHSALHMAREDAHCVLHLHTPYGVAVSAQKKGLRRYTQFSMIVHDDIAYHDYEGIATDLDERERLVKDIGGHNFLILRNHGTLTVGANCATAFLRMYFLEQACRAQILAQSDAEEPREEPPAMAAKVLQQGAPAFVKGLGDNLAWPGLLRKLNRDNPGYDA